MTPNLLVGWILAASTPALPLDHCYERGNESYRMEDFARAGADFEASASDPGCAAARGKLLISAAEAYRKAAETRMERRLYCRALAAYQAASETDESRRVIDAAIAGTAAMKQRCPSSPGQPAPPWTAAAAAKADDGDGVSAGWLIAGGAGVAALITVAILLSVDSGEPDARYRVRVVPLAQ